MPPGMLVDEGASVVAAYAAHPMGRAVRVPRERLSQWTWHKTMYNLWSLKSIVKKNGNY